MSDFLSLLLESWFMIVLQNDLNCGMLFLAFAVQSTSSQKFLDNDGMIRLIDKRGICLFYHCSQEKTVVNGYPLPLIKLVWFGCDLIGHWQSSVES